MNDLLRQVMNELSQVVDWSGGPSSREVLSQAALVDEGHRELLAAHDGLTAWGGGLRCFGVTSRALPAIASWNRADGWRSAYRNLTDGLLAFAEDVFGNQFCYEERRIVRLQAETGDREFVADCLEGWAQAILSDPHKELGLWLLHEWRSAGNTVQPSQHLCPKLPFVTGGAFEPSNLYVLDRHESMVFKGDFAWQIRNVPTGGKVRMTVTE
jgi:hypothetical protein